MEKNAEGRTAMTRVVLKPQIQWSGEKTPTEADLASVHEQAHHECFIANSVKTVVTVEA